MESVWGGKSAAVQGLGSPQSRHCPFQGLDATKTGSLGWLGLSMPWQWTESISEC